MPTACPVLLISAPASGQGKTTLTAVLARLHARLGRRVTVFKCGPDFIDPQFHAIASGRPCHTLDLGMCGEDDAAWRLAEASRDSDLILVEGVMGLHDGAPSSADIAIRFGLPVLSVIDASAMAQSFGAVVLGLAAYRPELRLYGALANQVGSPGHAALLRGSLPPGVRFCGAMPPEAQACWPERHLGLHLAGEIDALSQQLDHLADRLLAAAPEAGRLPPPTELADAERPRLPPLLAGRTIAIARDAAFCFIYPANLDTLEALGATLRFFSPLQGEALPPCDAAWLPGGYPELNAAALSGQVAFGAALAALVDAGKPLLAECGGMMGLFDGLTDQKGRRYPMAGLLPGEVAMRAQVMAIGTQAVVLPEGGLRGHSFHFSEATTSLPPLAVATGADGSAGEAVYRRKRLTASYLHLYFPSNPLAVAALFS